MLPIPILTRLLFGPACDAGRLGPGIALIAIAGAQRPPASRVSADQELPHAD